MFETKAISMHYDLVVVGGGLSGMCAAIAAARQGVHTALVHDRPVLGGNASSEFRMHICGADEHMTRPNARETGILEEILLEHKHRNPGNSYAVFDSILWEKAAFQPNLTLYLNTYMSGVETDNDIITAITAVQLTSEKQFYFTAGLFVDATGDGTLGFKAGADYSMGREAKATYNESYAPDVADHYTMGNSLLFRARDAGKAIEFVKPFWANTYTEEQLRLRDHSTVTSGYWWIELGGGEQNVIGDSEVIRDNLLKTVFGVWDHIKNSGNHGAENMDLEWVGYLPGKRESRRLLGDYVLNENDCRASMRFEDAVAYGGWLMDVHTIEGFRNENDNPTVWIHLDDVYTIPYRCLYSRNIRNLFMAGRAISCSHMAFASTRVMGTCAVVGQAVGTAAALAVRKSLLPRELLPLISEVQQQLLKDDCYIPGQYNQDIKDFARIARMDACHHINECSPEGVINGIARIVNGHVNCWRTELREPVWVSLNFPETVPLSEIRIAFDSNLSREITISISDEVLLRQSEGTPPELARDYRIDCYRECELMYTQLVTGNYQRHNILRFTQPVLCDKVCITVTATNGADVVGIFEVRAYL